MEGLLEANYWNMKIHINQMSIYQKQEKTIENQYVEGNAIQYCIFYCVFLSNSLLHMCSIEENCMNTGDKK